MKIILEPKVRVISVPNFKEHDVYKIPPDGDDLTKIGAFAAKGCYDSYGENGRSNIENQEALFEHRHGSVFEHIHIGTEIEGITRGLSLELNRHRTFNISQRSTRYTKEEESAIVLEPYFADLYREYDNWAFSFNPTIGYYDLVRGPNAPKALQILLDHLNVQYLCIKEYAKQVDSLIELNPNGLTGFDLRKWARGKARNVLSHGLETRGVWTNNIRGWRWFIELRSERHAEPEIRRLAHHTLLALKEVAPLYFEDFENIGVYDGIIEWAPQYSKV